ELDVSNFSAPIDPPEDENIRATENAAEQNNTTTEQQLTTFPEVAWQGPFKAWKNILSESTEAPLEYLWASCLVTLGLVLGRNVCFSNPTPLFPNFYVLLMGRTGDDKKSTTLKFAGIALEKLLPQPQEIDILYNTQSSEAIYESLARCDGAKTLIYCDEFR